VYRASYPKKVLNLQNHHCENLVCPEKYEKRRQYGQTEGQTDGRKNLSFYFFFYNFFL
jgi:hypothetical protein